MRTGLVILFITICNFRVRKFVRILFQSAAEMLRQQASGATQAQQNAAEDKMIAFAVDLCTGAMNGEDPNRLQLEA